jgi:Zn-dependent M28 family amino/carboxypeptidase
MLGSRAWVKAAKAADMTIRAALVLEMIGYRSLEPKTQELPAGFDLLFPEAVQRIHARQQTGDFIALIHNPKAARASALLVEEARRHGLPVEPLDVPPALVALPAASDLLRSDHAPFWSAGYPAVQLTDTAEFRNPYYHCEVGPDAAETLDYPFMASVVRMVVGATARLLDEP